MYINLRKFGQGFLGVIILGILLALATYPYLLVDLIDPSTRVSIAQNGQRRCIDAVSGFYDAHGEFVQHGVSRRYEMDGDLIWEYRYEEGALHGISFRSVHGGEVLLYTYYHQGWPIRERRVVRGVYVEHNRWVGGVRNGPWRMEDTRGNLIGEAYIVDGYPDGVMTRYDPPGVLYAETFWKNGEMIGKRLHQAERPDVWIYAYDHFPD